jgi:hypothetical protein
MNGIRRMDGCMHALDKSNSIQRAAESQIPRNNRQLGAMHRDMFLIWLVLVQHGVLLVQ